MNNSYQEDCDQCHGGLSAQVYTSPGGWVFCSSKCYDKFKGISVKETKKYTDTPIEDITKIHGKPYYKKHLDEVVDLLRQCQKSNNKYILDYNTQALLRYVNTISEEYKNDRKETT